MYHFSFLSHYSIDDKIRLGIPEASWAETVDDDYLNDDSRLNSLINGLPAGLWLPHK
jgi:hypothetical protein